jgi:surface antigen
VGTLLGALVGSEIGRSLDEADRLAAERTAYTAFERYPTGQQAAWQNPDTGNYGYTTPTRTYQTAAGQVCRDFQTAVVIQGQTETARGTACRQPDGTWRVVS